MTVIGLTGQSGAGKTTVSAAFRERGFGIINADRVARDVAQKGSKCLGDIVGYFGSGILTEDGALDRRGLGRIVFGDKEKKKILEKIIFPYIISDIDGKIKEYAENGAEFVLLDAPTLFESGCDSLCAAIVSVVADEKTRAERISKRDAITEEQALMRFYAQMDEAFFISHSDYVIRNESDEKTLIDAAERVCGEIRVKYGK